MEHRIIRTTFYISEFFEEEKWLESQHKSGWKFIKTNGKAYEFEKCPEEDWVYQLDFKMSDIPEKDYLQIYHDYGWEFIQHYKHWFFFRKKKMDNNEDYSIFSDTESKIEMCKRVIKGRLFRNILLPLLFLTVTYFCAALLIDQSLWKTWLHPVAMFCYYISVAYIFTHNVNQYKRVKSKIKKLKGH